MKLCFWTILSLISSSGCFARQLTFEGKIVGGTLVLKRDRFPSAVQFFNAGSLCAGTILNGLSVLTAAHCFDINQDLDDMVVQIGSRYLYDHQAQVRDVMEFVIHEDYNKVILFACDIALLFLKEPIELGVKSQKAILVNNDEWMNSRETSFKATGWGQLKYGGPISEKGLMMTKLRFVSSDLCERLHNLSLTPDMFCLYGDGVTDTCKGDSGGGILWNGLIVGVTSHGDGCAKKNKPSVYSNVWYFRDWIKKKVEDFINKYCETKNKTK